jgi:hypothetical protein
MRMGRRRRRRRRRRRGADEKKRRLTRQSHTDFLAGAFNSETRTVNPVVRLNSKTEQ